MTFPLTRLRRLRQSSSIRALVRETSLSPESFVLPLFVRSGEKIREPVKSMPGLYRFSADQIIEQCRIAMDAGIRAVLLFGIPDYKDERGSSGYDKSGVVQRAVAAIKKQLPGMIVITDVCNCEYTSHGHCGPLVEGKVDNDSAVEILSRQALSHVEAGCDMVAPSDMMDGRVGIIRNCLDCNGHTEIPIMSYSAKYASAFYGPFRDAVCTSLAHGDRSTYQMDSANGREAMREAALDLHEGADIIMIKPALAYLDIIRRVREGFDAPVAAYSVSGEYSMIKAAAQNGWLDEHKAMMEVLTSIKRAGADIIITYYAIEAAKILNS
ncbi:delta-aminolevulinic acid dehydratase [Chitinispirillum alkaliphilum]|nr:delta-aminolevulinic acid dehydratase [Chitinispirillum alkaliphilum]